MRFHDLIPHFLQQSSHGTRSSIVRGSLHGADVPLREIVQANVSWTVGSNLRESSKAEHLGFEANCARIDLEGEPWKTLCA